MLVSGRISKFKEVDLEPNSDARKRLGTDMLVVCYVFLVLFGSVLLGTSWRMLMIETPSLGESKKREPKL